MTTPPALLFKTKEVLVKENSQLKRKLAAKQKELSTAEQAIIELKEQAKASLDAANMSRQYAEGVRNAFEEKIAEVKAVSDRALALIERLEKLVPLK